MYINSDYYYVLLFALLCSSPLHERIFRTGYCQMSLCLTEVRARVFCSLKDKHGRYNATHSPAATDLTNLCYLYRIIFSIFFVLNLVLRAKQSSAAIPFGTLVALLALWFGISVPLVFVGAYFGFRKPVSHELLEYIRGWGGNYVVLSINLLPRAVPVCGLRLALALEK